MKNSQPPKWAIRFFSWFCRDDLSDAVLGDMLELYDRRCNEIGKRKADWFFIWNVISFFQPFAFKRKSNTQPLNNLVMFRNYSKIAWRNLFKHKMYSTIKIGGFAIGIAACVLISMYVQDELSFDKHYESGNRIYRLLNVNNDPTDPGKWTAFPAEVGNVLRDNFPDIEKAGRLIPYSGWWLAGSNQFRKEEQSQNTYEEGFAYADQDLLEILEVPMVHGDLSHALTEPKSIVMSKRKADKYFPNENPVGKVIFLNEDKENPYHIGAVMENFPSNSHLQFDFFITLTDVEFWPGEQTNWCCWNYNPYILVREGTQEVDLEDKLLLIRDNYIVPYKKERGDQRAENDQEYHSFDLQPVWDIRLKSEGVGDIIPHGDIKIVWLFGAIAVFILLLACINFINLSTAKSANRAKEIGLRKVVGSFRSNLIQQFLTESIIFSAISVALGIILARVLLPFFNVLSGKSLVFPVTEWWAFPLAILVILFIGVLAGVYPSFYLSAFKPIDVLRGSLSRGSKNSWLRGTMVVFQFTTSIVLIVGAFIVYRQMDFLLNKKLGFEKEQVIMIRGTNTLGGKTASFKNELMKLSEVQSATASSNLPVSGTSRNQNGFWKNGRNKLDKGVGAQFWRIDSDYLSTLGMKLVEGRNFSMEMTSDTASMIINQTMVKELGLENPIGKKISNGRTWNVIGVVEDFHFESMRGEEIGGLSFVRGRQGAIVSVKVKTKDTAGALASITTVWDEFMPNQPMRYNFLDESYALMYEDVKRTGNVFTSFAILAILVACLGLFGLSAFMAEQRRKEISIRKVLGASLNSIFQLLTVNFLKLIAISIVIAIPIGWYMMKSWLEDFEYRIDLSWDVFAIAGLLVVLIAVFTVSFESIKAAIVNPAKGLRSE